MCEFIVDTTHSERFVKRVYLANVECNRREEVRERERECCRLEIGRMVYEAG